MSWKFFSYEPTTVHSLDTFSPETHYKVYINNYDKKNELRDPKENEIFKTEVINALINDFKYFETLFKKYLRIKIEKKKLKFFDINNCVESNTAIGKINKVISYNFTSTPQKKFNLENDNIFYIHGYFDKEIIFGIEQNLISRTIRSKISDILWNNLNYFYKNTRRLNIYEREGLNLKKFVGGAKDFYIYGHSINDQDMYSLLSIFSNKFDDKRIIVFYYNDGEKNRIIFQLIKMVGGESELRKLRESGNIKVIPSVKFHLK